MGESKLGVAIAPEPTVPFRCPSCSGVNIERTWGELWRCVICGHMFRWTPHFTVEVNTGKDPTR